MSGTTIRTVTNIYDCIVTILERGLSIGDMHVSLGDRAVNSFAAPALHSKGGRPAKARKPGTAATKAAPKAAKRGKPIDADSVIAALRKIGKPADRLTIARKLGCSFHRLIRTLPTMAARGEIRALPGEMFEAVPASDETATAQ